MREIRFRAKALYGGKWIYGFFKRNSLLDCYIEDENGLTVAVDPETVGQLVCIANGEAIYEGDYIQDDNDVIWLIEYNNRSHAFVTVSQGGDFYIENDSEWISNDCVSVVGNRWDNNIKDLFKKEEKDEYLQIVRVLRRKG